MSALSLLFLGVGVFDKGGISRYCRYQITALRDLLGCENVQVVSLRGPGANDFEDPFLIDFSANGSNLRFLAGAYQSLRTNMPSVIWSSHVRLLPHAVALRIAQPHAALAANIYGEELWSGWRVPINRMLLRRMERVISDCQFSADVVVKEYGIAPGRISVVWDPVDIGRFRPQPRRKDLLRRFGVPDLPENRYVLTLGRIERRARYKGYDRLLDAMVGLAEYPNLVILFAGDGDDRPRLEARVREAKLQSRAFFLGSIPESLLVDVYNLCDVFALVSERGPGKGEGVPLTPLEAAACGKPIIVGNEDGSQEAVIDGVTGRVVSPRDPGAFQNALRDLSFDDRWREAMGREARKRIEREFSYEHFLDRTVRVLDQIVAGWKKEG